ncbi:MAG: tyrosine-type recombinase/integrase [Hyphomicrobium sp.]|jgi:integrase
MRLRTLKYVYEDKDRHGNVRVYFWRGKGHPKIRLRVASGTPEFAAAYFEAAKGLVPAATDNPPISAPKAGTLRWLGTEYLKSSALKQLDERTQRVRRAVLESMYDETTAPNAAERFADMPFDRVSAKAVRILRDRKADKPEAANWRVKTLRRVFAWALEQEHVTSNPARDVTFLKGSAEGFHTWSMDEVRQFEDRHPIGSKARLAMTLLLYTGQRRSDVVLFGRQHVRAGRLKFTQQKNKGRKPITLELPILPELQRVIDASPCGDLTFLVTDHNRPFTANGFGNKFRDWCDQAGLKHCSAHGLRKAGATRAAENGATPHQLMSIFGWLTLKQAEHYTRAVSQKRMADGAMHLLLEVRDVNNLSHRPGRGISGEKNGREI